jgi:hypothetical protein
VAPDSAPALVRNSILVSSRRCLQPVHPCEGESDKSFPSPAPLDDRFYIGARDRYDGFLT